jgi:hypothetical protein
VRRPRIWAHRLQEQRHYQDTEKRRKLRGRRSRSTARRSTELQTTITSSASRRHSKSESLSAAPEDNKERLDGGDSEKLPSNQITNHRLFKHCNNLNAYATTTTQTQQPQHHTNHCRRIASRCVASVMRMATLPCYTHSPNRCMASRCIASAVPPATLLKVLTLAPLFPMRRTIRVARIAEVRSNA